MTVDDRTIIEYSVANFVTSDEATVQLLLEKPSDVAVTDIQNARGANQFTAVSTIPPGQQETIRIHLEPNSAGSFEVTAIADYYVGDDQSDTTRVSESLQFDVEELADDSEETRESESRSDEGPPGDSTDDESPGFGVPTAISTLCGLGYFVYRRTPSSGLSDDKESD